jgi:uncharacterized protein YfaS (alpha-2-macroglobulin family)
MLRLLLLLLALLLPLPAAAQSFDLPGLDAGSQDYARELARRYPAGATLQQRAQAEQRAAQAERQGNWRAAVQAWEERIGMGSPSEEHWLALARAQLARTPPEPDRALQAAWRAFQMASVGEPEIPSLLLMVEALRRLDRPVAVIAVLEAVVERAPGNAAYREQLAAARRAAGLLVRRVAVEAEAEPARACLGFTVAPARRTDWRPEDWIRADPPLPGLAVLREGDQLCVAGLPWGRTTRLLLRAGLPGEDGQNLRADATVPVAVPNRAPRIAFDSRAFLLPRGQEPRVTVATVNVSALALRLVRVSERNLMPLRGDWTPGQAMEGYTAEYIAEDVGRVVWEGRAEIPRLEPNRTQRTALPLPEALRSAGPGLFVLVARSGDGRGARETVAALPLFATDLGLTVWRGADGLAVQARGLGDARPREGVRVALLARNNDVLAEALTGADGLVRFGAALLRGRGPLAPVAVRAEAGDDLAALDLEAASFDLSDRGATGRPHPGPLDAFVWLDRGIYRPGETVQASALLRDAGGAPADIPARLRLRRPNGQVFAETVPPRLPGAALHWPIPLSAGAPAGQWTLEVLADPDAPPIGRATFRVDAFVPERLEVQLGPAPGPLVPGEPLAIPVQARFLYGAPGAGLEGHAELRLRHDPEPFPEWKGWHFGLHEEQFAPDLQTFSLPETDAQGRSTLTVTLPRAPDTTRPLRADIALGVAEPGGRESRARIEVPVRPPGTLIALRPAFAGGAVDEGAEAAFDLAAVSPEGRAVAATLRLRLVRERPQWRIVVRARLARYETAWIDEPVDSAELRVAPGQPARFARRLGFGRYRVEVTEPGGLAITSFRFRSGWAGVEAAEVPDKVDVAADRRAYAPGETARLRLQPPFGGRAAVAVLTDRLVSLREMDLPEAGGEVEVPVDAAWGPGAYVAVTVFRPGEARNGEPARALGLAWLGLDPAARRLEVAIEAPPLARPRGRVEIPVRVAGLASGGTAMLTLAAVDEGILRLTAFAPPDPVGHFLGRRRLGVDIRDDYGRLIAPAEGEPTALRQGGDEGDGPGAIEIPQKTVALFSDPVAVGADGRAVVPLDLPDFAGELRLMAVAWDMGNRVGNAARPMTVRDPVVAEPLLPRFLAPGDEARIAVLLHNLDLPSGEVAAELSASGAVALAGPARLAAALAQGGRATPATTLRATGAGEGVLRLAVTGPGGFRAEREARLTIRSSRGMVTEVALAELPPGRADALAPPVARFLPGTWRASVTFGRAVRYDVAALLRAVQDFPLDCLEQSASRVLALSAMPADGVEGEERAARLQRAVQSVLDRQRYDGAFGLWSAQGAAEAWLTPYAVEALLRARTAGAAVPDAALEQALRHLEQELEEAGTETPEERAAQAYRVHALSLAGRHRLGAARRLLEEVERLPTPLAKAQLGAAFARAGDAPRAEAAFLAALAHTPARRFWLYDYGTATRDALAVALLLRESGMLGDQLTELLARLPGPELMPATTSTQEQGWAVAAAAALGQDGRPARIALDGQPLAGTGPVLIAALSGPATVRNLGDAPVWRSVSVSGVPAAPLPAARSGMRVRRWFFDLAGQPLDLDRLRQNTVFVLLIEAQAETGETHRAMLQQGLPAGWEIAGRLAAGEVPGMPWLGTLSEAAAQPALDDRFAASFDLTRSAPTVRLAVRLRAVTPGVFELPGAELADMYRPRVFARQNAGRVTVQPAD